VREAFRASLPLQPDTRTCRCRDVGGQTDARLARCLPYVGEPIKRNGTTGFSPAVSCHRRYSSTRLAACGVPAQPGRACANLKIDVFRARCGAPACGRYVPMISRYWKPVPCSPPPRSPACLQPAHPGFRRQRQNPPCRRPLVIVIEESAISPKTRSTTSISARAAAGGGRYRTSPERRGGVGSRGCRIQHIGPRPSTKGNYAAAARRPITSSNAVSRTNTVFHRRSKPGRLVAQWDGRAGQMTMDNDASAGVRPQRPGRHPRLNERQVA